MQINASDSTFVLNRSRLTVYIATAILLAVVGSWWSVVAPVGAQPGTPTTSLPEVETERVPGDIIPAPNSGRAPESPSDPGGWLQLSLFFIVLAAIVGMATYVWWQSKKARARRKAAGLDPFENAKRARSESLSEKS